MLLMLAGTHDSRKAANQGESPETTWCVSEGVDPCFSVLSAGLPAGVESCLTAVSGLIAESCLSS